MARGLLISFAGYPVMISSLFPDNGLASLAGTLLAAGHEVRVLDFNTVTTLRRLVSPERTSALAGLLPAVAGGDDPNAVERLFEINASLEADLFRLTDELAAEISKEVEDQNSNFVGFKLWSGDGFLASVRIAEHLKQNFPDLKIFGGGPAVLYSEHAVFSFTRAFDALVDGEGEQAIVALAEYTEGKRDLTSVPNLIVMDGSDVRRTERSLVPDLDGLAQPAYEPEIYPSLAGDEQVKLFILDESRGCPMGCAFCIHQDASGNRWRIRSASRVVEDVCRLSDSAGTFAFRLGGSYTPSRFLRGFIERLVSDGVRIRYCGFSHPQGLPLKHLESLARSGCKSLFLGVESFDPGDLARLGKRLSPERAAESIRACIEVGIVPIASVIVPAPGQTPEGLETNRQILVDLCGGTRSSVGTQFPGLLPRTLWWSSRQKYGFELTVSEDEYRRTLAVYKIRHIIPPAFWEPLPYMLDGRDFAGYAGENARFQRELAHAGVVINISDDMALLADMLEEEMSGLRSRLQSILFTLDAIALRRFVADVNTKLRSW